MTTPTPPSDLIERMARAMLAASRPNVNADDLTPAPRGSLGMIPKWKLYEHLAQAAYAVVRERIEWQPIETAPKNGTNIILASAEQTTFGKWLDNSKSQWPWQGWITPDGPWGEGAKKPITHWMPLPDPPSNKGLIHDVP